MFEIRGLIPKSGQAAVRLECFFLDGCVDSSSPSSSAFNSAKHSGGSQSQSVRRSFAIASRVRSSSAFFFDGRVPDGSLGHRGPILRRKPPPYLARVGNNAVWP